MPSDSKYQMWLLADGGQGRIPFPVLPEEYTVTYGNNTTSEPILTLGELAMRGDPNAIRVGFDAIFPSETQLDLIEAYVPENMKKATAGTWKFVFDAYLKRPKGPLQLNIVGTPVNMHCFCSRYELLEVGGEVGTYTIGFEFVEYKAASLELVKIDPVTNEAELPPKETKRLDTRVAPVSVDVQPGDTIASIAKRVYGTDEMYNAIYEKNKDILSNPQLLEPGTTLKMPL
ncbi:MAG: LysM peptidoglycan-binding domain-containing protein [Roseburia sp.]|nr:LysM peptidoglycan-binding domain-containing protein [Roseburia sp.]